MHRHDTGCISFVTKYEVHTTHKHPPMPVRVYFYRRMLPKISLKKKNCVKIKKSATKMLGNTRLNYSPFLHLYYSFCIWQSHLSIFLCPIQGTGRTLPFLSHGPVFCLLLPPAFLQIHWVWWVFHGAHQPAPKLCTSDGFIFTTHLFSRFRHGRKWKKLNTGFAVQVEMNIVFLKNLIFDILKDKYRHETLWL